MVNIYFIIARIDGTNYTVSQFYNMYTLTHTKTKINIYNFVPIIVQAPKETENVKYIKKKIFKILVNDFRLMHVEMTFFIISNI